MEHPITPPPKLVAQWYLAAKAMPVNQWEPVFAAQAARWGADQELEACCEWLPKYCPWDADQLRDARRPKPPSLKEQALAELRQLPIDPELGVLASALDTIRCALEALPND